MSSLIAQKYLLKGVFNWDFYGLYLILIPTYHLGITKVLSSFWENLFVYLKKILFFHPSVPGNIIFLFFCVEPVFTKIIWWGWWNGYEAGYSPQKQLISWHPVLSSQKSEKEIFMPDTRCHIILAKFLIRGYCHVDLKIQVFLAILWWASNMYLISY